MANYIIYNGELYHYGVPGMKWGVRKGADLARKSGKFLIRTADRVSKRVDGQPSSSNRFGKSNPANVQNSDPHEARIEKAKKAVKIGAVVAGTVLAAYGIKKLKDVANDRAYERGMRKLAEAKRAVDLYNQREWLRQQGLIR